MAIADQSPTLLVQTISVAISGVLASQWLGWLPPLVALLASAFAVVWYAIQIWESRTIQRWRRRVGWHVPLEQDEI
jgi:L-lactate permease